MLYFISLLILWYFLVKVFNAVKAPTNREYAGSSDYIHSEVFKLTLPARDYVVTCLFLTMGMLAKAKGRVDDSDIDYAEQVMDTMHLNEDLRRMARQLFNYGKDKPYLLNDLLREIREKIAQPEVVIGNYFDICVGLLSGSNQQQLYILKTLSQYAGMSGAEFAARMSQGGGRYQSRQQYSYSSHSNYNQSQGRQYSGRSSRVQPSPLQDAYKLFGITDPSSIDKNSLKKKYRRMMKEYHPDKFASSKDKALYEKALRKSQEINVAYDLICEAKGFSKN